MRSMMTPARKFELAKYVHTYDRNSLRAKWRFEDWQHNMKLAPTTTLTEEEWLETVAHFNGCAICGADEIVTRGFLIDPANGGMCTVWNVLPMCSDCSKRIILYPNIFRVFKTQVGHGVSSKADYKYKNTASAKRCLKSEEVRFMEAVQYLFTKMGDNDCLIKLE